MEGLDVSQERRYCSRLGFAMLLAMLWAVIWQFCLAMFAALAEHFFPAQVPDMVYYLLIFVGHYAVSLPLAYWLCRGIPAPPFCREPLGARRMARWFVIGTGLLWLGSLLGGAVNEMAYRLAGREPVDLLDETFSQLPVPVIVLCACMFGPLCEELLFRGLLANRLARYGQKPGALVSALLFGLYHANLGQFFYAFALGLLLAYAYYRTGRLLAPVLLHMLFNFVGSGLPMLLPDSLGVLALYGLCWLAAAVASVILLIGGHGRRVWLHGLCPPSVGVIFGSVGMTMAIVACFVELALNFVWA